MSSEQITTLIAVVAFLAGASAVLKVRTMQNTIDQQGELIEVQERRLTFQATEMASRDKTIAQQQQQINVLTNTVNSSDLIRALDEHMSALLRSLDGHLAGHHTEAMGKLDRQHRDLVSLKNQVSEALRK